MSGGFFMLQVFLIGLPPFVGANDLYMREFEIMKQTIDTLVTLSSRLRDHYSLRVGLRKIWMLHKR
jgi:hypothetical protein